MGLATIFATTKLVLLFLFARIGFFVMDEFQQGGYARYIDEGFYETLWPFKTVLYAYYFRLSHLLGDSAQQILVFARMQGFLLAVVLCLLVYGVARRMSRPRVDSFLAVCALLSFSTFMERAYRLRSEPLATVLGMASLLVVARETRTWRRVAVAGLLAGAAFLCTQKAIYLNLALGLALVGDSGSRRQWRDAFVQGAVLLAGWGTAILAYAVSFGGSEFTKILRHLFLGPASFARHGGAIYPDIRDFLGQTLSRNWFAYGLCLLGWLLMLYRWRRATATERLVWIFTGVIAASVFSHSQPWPYVFVMALPAISIWIVEVVRAARSRWAHVGVAALAILALISLGFPRNVAYLQYGNQIQLETIGHAEALLAPSDVYMDGIGMVVTRKIAGYSWWDGPHVQAIGRDPSLLDPIFAESPKVWILSYRTSALKDFLLPRFRAAYVPVYPNVLLAGIVIPDSGRHDFAVPWPGDYRLFDLSGEPLDLPVEVDGRSITGSMRLEKRRYSVRVPGVSKMVCILPADAPGSLSLPPTPIQRELFHRVYRN